MIRTLLATIALMAFPLAVSAAPGGLAWDSVTKLLVSADSSTLEPGDFAADFAAASAVQVPQSNGGGGIFGKIHQAVAMGQGMQQMMQTGLAQHHYVAGSKERTDDLAMQTATITDCAARTITTLDLRAKTYRVVSMDQPAGPSSGGGHTSPSGGFENGGHVAISIKSTALGAREVGGESTNGYRADMTITTTTASGESSTQNGTMLGYYSSLARPTATCLGGGTGAGGGGSRGPEMMAAGYARLIRALSTQGTDPHFSMKYDGPLLPMMYLSMFDAVTFTAQGRGAATMVVERGNVHTIAADDAVFGVPAGFTQTQ